MNTNLVDAVFGLFSRSFPFQIQIIAENLYVPWSIDVSDEDTLFFTERSGAVRMIKDGILNPQPLITFTAPFVSHAEGGLMGIALDPDFSRNHFMYVMHSYQENQQIYNRVVRLLVQNDSASVDRILIDKIPGGLIHNGGRLKFGPDGKLYIATGDAGKPELAQDVTSTAGKILRLEPDGRIPTDNPFPNSPVYALGLRNPQGMAWSQQNNMYASEHGSVGQDEINLIIPGGNYGWPLVQGDQGTSQINTIKPLISSGAATWAPSGIALLRQGPWQGRLLAANLLSEQLLSFTLSPDGTAINGVESWLLGQYGRLREVFQARDGSIYITTSNRDGRGRVLPKDDKIIRLILK